MELQVERMVEYEGKVETSSHIHTREAMTAKTINPENDLKNRPSTPDEEENTTQRRVKCQTSD